MNRFSMSDFDEPRRRERASGRSPGEPTPPWLDTEVPEETTPLPAMEREPPEEREPAPERKSRKDTAAWRSRRKSRTTTRQRPRRAIPTSPQEMQLWLQRGGWIYIAAIAMLLVIALVGVISLDRSEQRNPFAQPTPLPQRPAGPPSGAGATTAQPTTQPTVTPATLAATDAFTRTFVVYNTGGAGLFLRADHSTSSEELGTLSDGTRVQQIGEDYVGVDYVWRKVRAPDGQEGWVAVDFLREAP